MNRLKESSASAGLALCCVALLIAVATILLACESAAQTAPADDVALPAAQGTDGDAPAQEEATNTPMPAQQEGGDSTGESGIDSPTEMPPPPPVPTLTYPKIEDSQLHFNVVDFEEAQDAVSGPSGQSDAAPEDAIVYVRILLSGNKSEVAAWLRSRGITPIHADDPDISNLSAEAPLSLLGELSQQDGVREIRRPIPPFPGQ